MRLIITPKLVSSLEDHPGIWQGLQDWRLNVESFLDAIGMVAQAELTAEFQSDSLCGRMNLFLSPPLTRFRVDKADVFWQIKYFEEELSLPQVNFIYGYGQIER